MKYFNYQTTNRFQGSIFYDVSDIHACAKLFWCGFRGACLAGRNSTEKTASILPLIDSGCSCTEYVFRDKQSISLTLCQYMLDCVKDEMNGLL